MRTGPSRYTATVCENGNCFPSSIEQAHEKHGCKGEMVQKQTPGMKGMPCEMYEIVPWSLILLGKLEKEPSDWPAENERGAWA
jgi:hypothetical protein